MKTIDLELIKKLALQAAEGEWLVIDEDWSDGDNAEITTQHRKEESFQPIAVINGGGSQSGYDEPFLSEQQANAAYIAAVNPETVLALIRRIEAAEVKLSGVGR
ncbi:hypothetical protein [Pantoea sp. BAV 3049]|uniref:hypothetical protein n=1 Tax=Pantoea sp. BAV 3049 TaxID=2654188 RepID=UPI00131A8596|nr:hypothetical protein [Pantoea sp. BAV 3049]